VRPWLTGALLVLATGMRCAGGEQPLKPPAIWKDYDPGAGDFREEVVKQETANGVFGRDSYISAYVLDQEIRVYCIYRVRAGARAAPGLLDVHGWMGAPSPSNQRGSDTEQLNDPKWRAPVGKQLGIKFHCTQPQTLILTAGDYNEGEIGIPASDNWQEMVVKAGQLINRLSKQPMKDWSQVGKIHLKPKAGSDINKVVFAEFRWVRNSK
jgi:hypothetical protein